MSGRDEELRPDYAAYQRGWREAHPGWHYRYWDHESARALIADHYPWFLETYDRYPFFIQRCDAVRYFILHHEGGLYVDMDIENLKPVDDLFADNALSLFATGNGYFTNAAMASAPAHPLWEQVVAELPRRAARPGRGILRLRQPHSYYIINSTGPLLLSDCVRAGGFDRLAATRVHPRYIFEPLQPIEVGGKIVSLQDTSRSYAVHHSTMHWLSRAGALREAIGKAIWKYRGMALGARVGAGDGAKASI